MGRVLPIVVAIALLVYALIDCLQTDSARFRSLNRFIWVAIIVLIPLVGPLLWLAIGKAREQRRPVPPPSRPVAPDDDPEFLRQLRDIDTKHEKMLGEWEADLRRREQRMRGTDKPADEPMTEQERKDAELRKREDESRHGSDDDDDPR
ncbi:PLD nuclease N-terminal domain-containing protein [Jiangella gansuensis]|uniref:PLD nuclease N-terminal domain-containing protein n=1 Tax=Jiangella gansuensis TaxID=281473 RepID=UPI000A05D3D4|nr:PLD nuclease N-terminal domain-containing protein [Jiangella gansuensis]